MALGKSTASWTFQTRSRQDCETKNSKVRKHLYHVPTRWPLAEEVSLYRENGIRMLVLRETMHNAESKVRRLGKQHLMYMPNFRRKALEGEYEGESPDAKS